jgi:hypothetical protein
MKNKQLELDPELEAVGQIAMILRPFDTGARLRICMLVDLWRTNMAPEPVKRGRKPKEAANVES